MNKLTTINTIKKAAPLALLAVVMSGSAFAGPKEGTRPAKAKLSIDVENLCVADGRYMDVTAKVTLSGSQKGDGGGDFGDPTADAMFKKRVCTPGPGKSTKCETGFDEVGAPQSLDGPTYDANLQAWFYKSLQAEGKGIDLCATKSGETLSAGTPVNALISVPVNYYEDDTLVSTAYWISNCDDIPYEDDFEWVDLNNDGLYTPDEWIDTNDQSDVQLKQDVICP